MQEKYKTLIFLGPQGSGKGTQANLLVDKFGYTTFSTGAILRGIAEEDSALGQKVKKTIDAGHLVEPELVTDVVKEKLLELGPGSLVIIDGYPRSLEQLKLMNQIMPEVGREDLKVVFFDIIEEETLKRLSLRAKKEGRADDSEDGIQKRLEYFRDETLPMVEEMEKKGLVVRIDGMSTIENIHQDVVKKLKL